MEKQDQVRGENVKATRNQNECTNKLKTILPVAAAASAPSSFTSMKAFCITSLTARGSELCKRPEKSALSVNMISSPN